MSLRLICFIQFTRWLWTGRAGFAPRRHVLLTQARFALGSLHLVSSLFFPFLSAELTVLVSINGIFQFRGH